MSGMQGRVPLMNGALTRRTGKLGSGGLLTRVPPCGLFSMEVSMELGTSHSNSELKKVLQEAQMKDARCSRN